MSKRRGAFSFARKTPSQSRVAMIHAPIYRRKPNEN